jgi:hypothetical protein
MVAEHQQRPAAVLLEEGDERAGDRVEQALCGQQRTVRGRCAQRRGGFAREVGRDQSDHHGHRHDLVRDRPADVRGEDQDQRIGDQQRRAVAELVTGTEQRQFLAVV